MKVLNNNPLDCQGANGERLSLTVRAVGIPFVVGCALDDAAHVLNEGSAFSFPLAKTPTHRRALLTLVFSFPPGGSGHFECELAGSLGGRCTYTVTQLQGMTDDAITYTIDIV